MTVSELHKKLSRFLSENSIEDSSLEARYFIEHILKISYSDFLLRAMNEVADDDCKIAEEMAERRVKGVPLQYIIGEWDFMGYTFNVGEGVLIPRPETEILCEYVLDRIKNIPSPVVYDLCSGSGCIGISIKKNRPDARVILVEKSDKALKYLRRNSHSVCAGSAPEIIEGDILNFEAFDSLPFADVIVSNPPYIRSEEIPTLQKEVQREPVMALDGGEDGLIFYRCLVKDWSKKLKNNGFMAFECGEYQGNDINILFSTINFDSKVILDYNNLERCVIGWRKTNVI